MGPWNLIIPSVFALEPLEMYFMIFHWRNASPLHIPSLTSQKPAGRLKKKKDYSRYSTVSWSITNILFCWFLQAQEDISKSLVGMKNILYGAGDQEPQTELIGQLAQAIYESCLLLLLIKNLPHLDFEVWLFGLSRLRGMIMSLD